MTYPLMVWATEATAHTSTTTTIYIQHLLVLHKNIDNDLSPDGMGHRDHSPHLKTTTLYIHHLLLLLKNTNDRLMAWATEATACTYTNISTKSHVVKGKNIELSIHLTEYYFYIYAAPISSA